LKVAGLLEQPLHNREEAKEQRVAMFKLIGSRPALYPIDDPWLRDIGARSYERAYDPAGRLRQQEVRFASGDRRKALAQIHVLAPVIHGDADPLFRLKGAESTAAAIRGAHLAVYPGMGHGALPRQLWPKIIDVIGRLTSER
jgi:pimeloyl-ACP methyl ester carboxylesterase